VRAPSSAKQSPAEQALSALRKTFVYWTFRGVLRAADKNVFGAAPMNPEIDDKRLPNE
jgi:hypothetical protein